MSKPRKPRPVPKPLPLAACACGRPGAYPCDFPGCGSRVCDGCKVLRRWQWFRERIWCGAHGPSDYVDPLKPKETS